MAALHTTRYQQLRGRAARRAGALTAAAALAYAGLALPAAAPAQAAPGDLDCTGKITFSFDPPLTSSNDTAVAKVDGALLDCISANGNYADLTSGTTTAQGSARAQGNAPCALILAISGTGTITWNTGQKSAFDFHLSTDPSVGPVGLHTQATRGPMAGDSATTIPIVTQLNPDCAAGGLKYLSLDRTAVAFS